MTWASELFEKEEMIYVNPEKPSLKFIQTKKLVLAVVEIDKKIQRRRKQYIKDYGIKGLARFMDMLYSTYFRELVAESKKVKE